MQTRFALVAACALAVAVPAGGASDRGLTAVPGIRVGHHTLAERPTGCTVVLADGGAVGGVDVRGAAPGTRETELLNPTNLVDQVHAIRAGRRQRVRPRCRLRRDAVPRRDADRVPHRARRRCPSCRRPSCSTSASADPRRSGRRPTAATRRPRRPPTAPWPKGNVGAGAGATVGKLLGPDRAMKGGVGTASITLPQRPDRGGAGRGQRVWRRHRPGDGPA